MDKLKSIYASANSASITIAVVTIVTIGAELSAEFKTLLAGFTGHHWVTKSWLSVIIFALFFGLFWFMEKSVSPAKAKRALSILQVVTIVGFFLILGFYVYHFFTA